MKLSTARQVMHYPVLQIAQLGVDDDGGTRVLEYLATDDLPEWPHRPIALPPRLPRPEPWDVWVIVAGIGLAVWFIFGCIGVVTFVRWLARGG